MKRRAIWWGLAALALAAGIAYTGLILIGRWHPSTADFPRQGIDVSHHNGAIDWRTLRAQGVSFAYIKSSEGGDYRDPAFITNWNSAAAAGVDHGAYHFFTLCRSGKDQADNFLATVPQDSRALPPAIDLEYLGNCEKRPSPEAVRRELVQFLARIEARDGPAILYLTEEFDRTYEISTHINRPLWLRRLLFQPTFGARPWGIWQASNARRLQGISGRVDWNVMRREP